MEADEALIQSRGVREEAEDVRSTKVKATRTMRVVAVGSTLETWAGSENENMNSAAVIEAAVCMAAVTETLADCLELGDRSKDARAR